jgi:hypothetical protein
MLSRQLVNETRYSGKLHAKANAVYEARYLLF